MSNETEIEDVTPVDLPEETVVEDTETVEESTDEGVVDEVVAQAESLAADIKTKIKGMPETDSNNVIGSSRTKSEGGKKFGKITETTNGAIGSGPADMSPKVKATEVQEPDKVAVFSDKNILVEGLGKINKGYNIFPKDVANKWLKRNYVRLATPEEVAEEYGI
jgi:hypothetical protein